MDYKIKEETLSGIADAIRSKSGSSEAIKVSEFAEQIETIPTGSDFDLIENLPIAVDFSQGNQFVEAPEGQAVKSAVIQKPTNLVPENIAEGVNVAGITGTLEPFNVEILENIPINLDFSNGNQTIEAEEGYLVKSATVFKPETLIPENIADGINIAGIVGTLASGGGSGGGSVNYNYKYGWYDNAKGTSGERISYNFGFKPDFLLVATYSNVTIGTSNFLFYGVSSRAKEKGIMLGTAARYISSNKFGKLTSSNAPIDLEGGTIGSCDETGFNINVSHVKGEYEFWAFSFC